MYQLNLTQDELDWLKGAVSTVLIEAERNAGIAAAKGFSETQMKLRQERFDKLAELSNKLIRLTAREISQFEFGYLLEDTDGEGYVYVVFEHPVTGYSAYKVDGIGGEMKPVDYDASLENLARRLSSRDSDASVGLSYSYKIVNLRDI